MINSGSIYASSLVAIVLLPQLFFFLIKGRKVLPTQLYQGKYFWFGVISLISYLAIIPLILFFSTSFGVIAQFFAWLFSSHTCVAAVLVGWIIFFMHGYEIRYLFEKIVVPAYMNVLIVMIYVLTAAFSLNYWAAIPTVIFSVFSLIWSFKAYKLTRPAIDDDAPLREDYE